MFEISVKIVHALAVLLLALVLSPHAATAQGIDSLEQCSVAIRTQGTKAENVVPAVKVIGNSWISLMAYQAKGYAYISP